MRSPYFAINTWIVCPERRRGGAKCAGRPCMFGANALVDHARRYEVSRVPRGLGSHARPDIRRRLFANIKPFVQLKLSSLPPKSHALQAVGKAQGQESGCPYFDGPQKREFSSRGSNMEFVPSHLELPASVSLWHVSGSTFMPTDNRLLAWEKVLGVARCLVPRVPL